MKNKKTKISVVGGGASGFFSAIRCKEVFPNSEVVIYEKSKKILSKVKISGGGRCNVTNSEENLNLFANNYPRGKNQLKKIFGKFGNKETIEWFEKRGVKLIVQEDKCIFPKAQNSQVIIDCFLSECSRLGIKIILEHHFIAFQEENNRYRLSFKNKNEILSDKIIFSLGGLPNRNQFSFFKKMNYKIKDPVPSLFTFNIPNNEITKLNGIVVEKTTIKINSTKLFDNGPTLITHWGLSGPSVLKTSAWGARILNEKKYNFSISINWLNNKKNEDVLKIINTFQINGATKSIKNEKIKEVPKRLWEFLLKKAKIPSQLNWREISKKEKNKIIELLINDTYEVIGKTTFKEEFVTCGGICLSNVNTKTLESKIHKGIYFTGEFLDFDGITGGFNFQSAWTTGYIAGELK